MGYRLVLKQIFKDGNPVGLGAPAKTRIEERVCQQVQITTNPNSFEIFAFDNRKKSSQDSGATNNFICSRLLKHPKIGRFKLKNPRTIWNIDGTHNKSGTISECVNLLVQTGDRRQEMCFLITDLGEDEIILRYPWLATFQPCIDWKNATLDQEMQPLVIRTWTLPWTKKSHTYAKLGYTAQKIWQSQEKKST